jgi:hypothetical protein
VGCSSAWCSAFKTPPPEVSPRSPARPPSRVWR